MLLQAALANAVLGAASTVDAVGSTWSRALESAEKLDDIDQQLRASLGLCPVGCRSGEYRKGLASASSFCTAAEKKSDPSDLLLGDRIVGVSLFCLGDPGGAQAKIERIWRDPALGPRLQAVRFGLDPEDGWLRSTFHAFSGCRVIPTRRVRTAAGPESTRRRRSIPRFHSALRSPMARVRFLPGLATGQRRRLCRGCCQLRRRSLEGSRSGTPMVSHGEAGGKVGFRNRKCVA